MNGRRLLAIGLILAAVVTTLLVLWPSGGVERFFRQGRSVVLVTLDTTRADVLGPYGGDARTPHLSALAEQGRVYENAYSVAPITLVAHTSLLTGLYPPEHGVRNNGLHVAPGELETLAELLGGSGFGSGGHRTAAFVSAAVLEARYGLDQGFDVYDDDLSSGLERHPNMVPDRPAGATVDSARAWLDELTVEDSFFLWIHLYDPHAPYSPPEPFAESYPSRPYLGEIAYMDAQIGRLLEHPRINENTVVAVVGDHGESLGEHGERTHAILAYDSTLHVPFLLRAPGVEPGSRSAEPVSHVDLLPTLLGLLGREASASLRGRDLLAAGADPASPLIYSETYLPHYTYGWAKLRAARRGPLKFIEGPDPELYDLSRDPRELSNLWAEQPGPAHDMARDLAELAEAFGDIDRENHLELDSESLEKLRSLGYLAAGDLPERSGPAPDPKALIELHTGLERARHLARDHLYELAELELRKVLERDRDNLAARLELAEALAQQGRADAAIEEAKAALALDPSSVRGRLRLAAFEQLAGRPAEALALYETILDQDPGQIEARLRKASLLVRSGRSEEGAALLSALLADHPDHPQALVQHAIWVDLRAGDRQGAEAHLRAAVARDPFFVRGWLRLGELLEGSGQTDAAEQAYRSGLAKAEEDADLHARLGQLLSRSGEAGAEHHLRQALRLTDRLRSDVLIALGNHYQRTGDRSAAEAAWGQLAAAEPENADDHANRSLALYSLGRVEDARKALYDLLARWPGHLEARTNLVALSVELGDFATAERQARQVLGERPESAPVWNSLGVALAKTGRAADALDAYERAMELDPADWRSRFNHGMLLAEGDPVAAEQGLLRALGAGAASGFLPATEQAEAHWRLARAVVDDPRPAGKRREHLEAFLEFASPDDPRRAEAESRLRVSGEHGG